MAPVAVIDVGLGNVASVRNMLGRIGTDVVMATQPESLAGCSGIVLPGVGAYDTGVRRLKDAGLFEVLRDLPPEKPLLGICLGMQLLGVDSQEGSETGLGRVNARFVRFPDAGLPVPHMGWNELDRLEADPVMRQLPSNSRFYFTHSYYAICADVSSVIGRARYGEDFTAAFRNHQTIGVQFHPEKSHRFGVAFLKAWIGVSCSETE